MNLYSLINKFWRRSPEYNLSAFLNGFKKRKAIPEFERLVDFPRFKETSTEFLDKKITYDGEIKGSELIGKSVIVPHRNESIVMLPASFVESGTGTGMVMSVPAHAPFDHQALEDLKKAKIEPKLETSYPVFSFVTLFNPEFNSSSYFNSPSTKL